MPKKRIGKAFWRNFKFKYKISITNENTLEEVASLYVSKLNGLSVLLSILFVIFSIAASIIAFTPLRNYLPGYMNSEVREQIVRNALLADSLTNVLAQQNLYILNVQDIIKGEVKVDSTLTMAELMDVRQDTLMERTEREAEFRRQYEEAEKYNLSTINIQAEVGGLIFHAPTRGLVSEMFDPNTQHYGVNIIAKPGESVLAALDGTVVFSGYTLLTGYVMVIKHSQEFLTIYKHCGTLMKKEGDVVKSGDVIAMIGNTGTQSTGPHLHFELWHKDRAVDPVNYIIF